MIKEKHYTINRKDGITYEKTYYVNDFDCNLNIRYSRDKKNKLKTIAKEENKSYNELVRYILDKYMESYKFDNK